VAATVKRVLLVALVLCGCAKRDRIVVGAKNFTESDLLAEIVAQQIERRTSLPVERRLHLGGTFVCHRAITAGDIDMYVEYTGTAFTAILKQPPVADPDSVYRFVAAEYARLFKVRWTAPFGFNNTFAILVRRADAERYGLRSIADLARVAPRWKAGFGFEFLERADGFAGLARVYGLHFSQPPTSMDLGLTYRALADGRVDVIAGNSTDGQIAALDLVALVDDRGYFPPYQAAPVVRAAVLEKYPAVAAALAELGGKISDAEMRRLNALADVEHKDITLRPQMLAPVGSLRGGPLAGRTMNHGHGVYHKHQLISQTLKFPDQDSRLHGIWAFCDNESRHASPHAVRCRLPLGVLAALHSVVVHRPFLRVSLVAQRPSSPDRGRHTSFARQSGVAAAPIRCRAWSGGCPHDNISFGRA